MEDLTLGSLLRSAGIGAGIVVLALWLFLLVFGGASLAAWLFFAAFWGLAGWGGVLEARRKAEQAQRDAMVRELLMAAARR